MFNDVNVFLKQCVCVPRRDYEGGHGVCRSLSSESFNFSAIRLHCYLASMMRDGIWGSICWSHFFCSRHFPGGGFESYLRAEDDYFTNWDWSREMRPQQTRESFSQVILLCYGTAHDLCLSLRLTVVPFSTHLFPHCLSANSSSVFQISSPLLSHFSLSSSLLLTFSFFPYLSLSACTVGALAPLLYKPPSRQTVMLLCYRNVMRLGAPKLKEAIFYSCQLIIERGEPVPLKAAEERRMVMEGWKGGGGGFEVRRLLKEERDGELRGELFQIWMLSVSSSLGLFSGIFQCGHQCCPWSPSLLFTMLLLIFKKAYV